MSLSEHWKFGFMSSTIVCGVIVGIILKHMYSENQPAYSSSTQIATNASSSVISSSNANIILHTSSEGNEVKLTGQFNNISIKKSDENISLGHMDITGNSITREIYAPAERQIKFSIMGNFNTITLDNDLKPYVEISETGNGNKIKTN